MSSQNKLSQKYAFWYHTSEELLDDQINRKTSGDQEYEDNLKKLAEFETLEEFWSIFQYMKKPDDCKPGIEFQLFKDQIKPAWEDENNKQGGRISIKLRKNYSTLVWEESVLAFIGNTFPEEVKEQINGIVINCKKDFNMLQLWIKNFKEDVASLVEKNIREVLQIPNEVVLEIKPFFQPKKEYNNYNNNYNNYKRGGYYKKNKNYYNKDSNNNNNEEKDVVEKEADVEKKEKEEKNEKEVEKGNNSTNAPDEKKKKKKKKKE